MSIERRTAIREDCKKSISNYLPSLEVLREQSVLITGGSGFVGKWLAEAICLLNDEHNFNTRLYLLARNFEYFKVDAPHLVENEFITLIEKDIRFVDVLPDDVQWIIHAAANPDSREHISQPTKVANVIIEGTQSILNASLRLTNLKKIIHISSSYVYGNPSNVEKPFAEDEFGSFDPNSMTAVYGEAKRMAETICSIHKSQNRLPITIVRPFSFLGPYQELDKPWAINNFMRDSILGGPVRILGDENVIRTYLYGSDVAFWILKLLVNGKVNEAYNLGGEVPISLSDLAKKITSKFSNRIEIIVRNSKAPSIIHSKSIPDLSKLKRDTAVNQTIDMDNAIERTLSWYKR